jgi:hypothetical protein
MVKPDFAKFVDEHDRIRQGRIAKKPVQQGRLAGAEEACDDGDRNGRRRVGGIVSRRQLIAALLEGFTGCDFVAVAFFVALAGADLTLWAAGFVAILAVCFGFAPRRIESAFGSGRNGAGVTAFSGDA